MITLFQVINGLRALPLLGNLVKNKRSLSRQGGSKIWRFAPLLLVTFENLRKSSVMFGSCQMHPIVPKISIHNFKGQHREDTFKQKDHD